MSNYKWVNPSQLRAIDWKNYDSSQHGNTGYFLRVSLRYPPWLQDLTTDLTLCPQKFSIQYTELPTYHQRKVKKHEKIVPKTFVSQPRLVAHCYDRTDMAIHYSALRFYLQQGMELLDIKEGFSFREEPVFRKMIEFTVEKRRQVKSNAMNSVLKLVSNSLYVREDIIFTRQLKRD